MNIENLPLIARAVNAAMSGRQTTTAVDGIALAEAWLDRQLRRGETEVFSVVADLTPDLAGVLLRRNDGNRAIKSKAEEFRRDIEGGRWQLNGEPIIIAVDGSLNDGQHRCVAVIRADIAIRVLMVFGVARETRQSVDTGSARTPGDLLRLQGITDQHSVAAVCSYLWQIEEHGRVPDVAHAPNARPTKQQVLEVAGRLLDRVEASMRAVPTRGASKVASHSQLVTMHAYIAGLSGDEDATTEFMRALVRGDKSGERDPIWVGRERLIEEKRKRHLWPAKAMEIILRSWNLHRRGLGTGKIQLMGEWPKVAK